MDLILLGDVIKVILLSSICCIFGIKEAILYSRKGAESFKYNEHIIWVIERCLILLLFTTACYFPTNLKGMIIHCVYFILSFSFFHNGFYFITQNKILNNGKNFFSYSETSTAVFELKFQQRLFLFLIGIIILFI